MDHIAGSPAWHPEMGALGRHYGWADRMGQVCTVGGRWWRRSPGRGSRTRAFREVGGLQEPAAVQAVLAQQWRPNVALYHYLSWIDQGARDRAGAWGGAAAVPGGTGCSRDGRGFRPTESDDPVLSDFPWHDRSDVGLVVASTDHGPAPRQGALAVEC